MKDRALYLGSEARDNFLATVRESLMTEHGREVLYDDARVVYAGLVRSERPEQELSSWADAFSRISALALATAGCDEVVVRFDTLKHLLRDEEMYRSAYSTEDLLRLPFCSRLLSWLHHAGTVSLAMMMEQLSLKETVLRRTIQSLSQQRLVDWSEESGALTIWITDRGRQEVIQF